MQLLLPRPFTFLRPLWTIAVDGEWKGWKAGGQGKRLDKERYKWDRVEM